MDETIRVLYAEDNPHDADLTLNLLEQSAPDIRLEVVGTADACRRRLLEERFDVLLLDQHLPDSEGIQLLRALAHEGLQQPVVMVTGMGDEELVVQTLRLGASDYIPKSGDYLEKLPLVLRGVAAEFRKKQGAGWALLPRRQRILYVEHNPMDLDLTIQYLSEVTPHLELEGAGSFREALRLLEAEHGYALILTDLRMQDASALDYLREARLRAIRLPCIVITGQGDEETAVAALKLGAFDYIVKREGYLKQLPHAIENALARFHLNQTNDELQAELMALNQSLEQKVRERTSQLQREIAERERAEQQLAASMQQLRHLADYLQSVQEQERAHIAREIHEELGQTLTGLKMEVIWLKRHLDPATQRLTPQEVRQKLDGMTELIDATISSVRHITSELRPAILDTLGLVSALEWQAQEFQNRTGIRCDFIAEVEEVSLDRAASTAVFRIFQETLTNVARHAGAHHVTARLSEKETGFVLEVHDDGIGIADAQVSATSSLGLQGMQERALMLGGELTLLGKPGRGTNMHLRIPIHAASERLPTGD